MDHYIYLNIPFTKAEMSNKPMKDCPAPHLRNTRDLNRNTESTVLIDRIESDDVQGSPRGIMWGRQTTAFQAKQSDRYM